MKKLILSLFILFISVPICAVQAIYPFANEKDEARFQALTQEIRCVVCQNQSIADSTAPLANDLREKVYRMVLAKESNDDIKYYLVRRYGDFILLNPPVQPKTYFLWLAPFVLLIGTVLFYFLRRFDLTDYIAMLVNAVVTFIF
jgi:cytochrome c-type biogenesis protein CcmH